MYLVSDMEKRRIADLDGECVHLLTRRWCGICNPNQSENVAGMSDSKLLDILLTRKGWIASSYPGYCADCGDEYDLGTPICVLDPNGRGDDRPSWKAMCCANENDIRRPSR